MTFLEALLQHSPALVIATPLLSAFLLPLVGRINAKVRDVFALVMLGVTCCFVGLLASDVLSHGPRVYIFGAQNLNVPLVRILFEVDSMSIFMAIITVMLAVIAVIYSWSFLRREDGLDKYYTLAVAGGDQCSWDGTDWGYLQFLCVPGDILYRFLCAHRFLGRRGGGVGSCV